MASARVRNTAFGAAMMKAFEGHTPSAQRLFEDKLIERLLPRRLAWIASSRFSRAAMLALGESIGPGTFGGMVCRTRALDDALRDAVARGVSQVVILGAGLDTRAYRMEELRFVRVWELDLPEVQAQKRRAIERNLGATPAYLQFVSIDFEQQSLPEALRAAGVDLTQPIVVLWEGVTQYLTERAVLSTFDAVAAAASGSRLLFTYVVSSVFTDPHWKRFVHRFEWKCAFEPSTLAARLREHGLVLLDDAGVAEYRKRYLSPLGRELNVFPIERVAVAECLQPHKVIDR